MAAVTITAGQTRISTSFIATNPQFAIYWAETRIYNGVVDADQRKLKLRALGMDYGSIWDHHVNNVQYLKQTEDSMRDFIRHLSS